MDSENGNVTGYVEVVRGTGPTCLEDRTVLQNSSLTDVSVIVEAAKAVEAPIREIADKNSMTDNYLAGVSENTLVGGNEWTKEQGLKENERCSRISKSMAVAGRHLSTWQRRLTTPKTACGQLLVFLPISK